MNRRSIREQVFKILFRAEFNSVEEMPRQEDLYFESGDLPVSNSDRKKISSKCRKILGKLPEIDGIISENLKSWRLARVGKVELAILRIAVYEIVFDPSVSAGVAVNEAVELAKKYGQDGAGAFVNGVLGTVVKKYAPADTQAEGGLPGTGDGADPAVEEEGE